MDNSIINTYIQKKTNNLYAVFKILNEFDNPQEKLKIIHVAGTNGKGSTVAMIYSILSKKYKNIGVFTSPHLININERIKIDEKYITDCELKKILKNIDDVSKKNNIKLGFFDILTICSFIYFYEKKCEIAIIETGLGGEFDATNVIKKPLVSVITNIGIDHEDILGSSIIDIAKAKSGIIKKNCPTVLYDIKEGEEIFFKKAKILNSKIIKINTNDIKINFNNQNFDYKQFKKIHTNLLGIHQIKNAVVVIETINVLKEKFFLIDDNDIISGLKNVKWDGRFQILKENDNSLLIIDGGHNPQCIEEVLSELKYISIKKFKNINFKLYIVISILKNKNIDEMFNILYKFLKTNNINYELIITKIDSEKAESIENIKNISKKYFTYIKTIENVKKTIEYTNHKTDKNIIFFIGSLYLIGEVLKIYKNK